MNEIYKKNNVKVHQLFISGIYRRSFKILPQIAMWDTLLNKSIKLEGSFFLSLSSQNDPVKKRK